LTIFCDASALIAIIVGEPDAALLADSLEHDNDILCSAVSVWETMAGLCHSYALSPLAARAYIDRFLEAAQIRLVPIGQEDYEIACDAYQRYGRGRHAAALNMGDCFAYAGAKANHARLLFKGQDFSQTDIPAAIA
jgi:ribonuclease VapC